MKKIYGLTLILLGHINASHATINCATQCSKMSPAANIVIDLKNPVLPPETLACLQECPISELSDFLLQIAPSLNHPDLWKIIGELDPHSSKYKEVIQEGCDINVTDRDMNIESPEIEKCHATSRLEFHNKTDISRWALSQDPATLKGMVAIAQSVSKQDPAYKNTIQGLLSLIKRIMQVDTNEIEDEQANDDLIALEQSVSAAP